jgi:hypothetical protein
LPEPNAFAYLMIGIWPLVTLFFWSRMAAPQALVWTILGGYLLLPPLTAFDLPLVPNFTKDSVPALAALFCAWVIKGDRVSFDPGTLPGRLLFGLFVLSPFVTVLTNSDPVPIQAGDIQGMRLYDSIATVADQLIVLTPMFLARRYLATPEALRVLISLMVLAGLLYSLPMLLEVRLSPQLNTWVYGFFQHEFIQAMRDGGFRPFVFLPHGLWVAFFALMAFVAAVVSFRAEPAGKLKALAISVYLGVVLVLCKSAGVLLYAAGLVPLVLLFGLRMQLVVAAGLALVVVLYPLLRGLQLVPLEAIVEQARSFSSERAASLAYRITNEEALLTRAAERPWFGWGGYGRGLIRDPVSGAIWTIPDGAWIIVLGIYGWLGYIAKFGLIALPLLRLGGMALRGKGLTLSRYGVALALILAANMVDMLPNATEIPFTCLMVGALMGYAETLRRPAAATDVPGPAPAPEPRTVI